MDRYESEQEQIDAIKRWWKDNGTALVLGLTVGLGGLFGWRYWTEQKQAHAEQASIAYELLLNAAAANRVNDAITIGTQLRDEFKDTTYATLGALILARFGVERGDYADARANLSWARERSKNVTVKRIASARIAQILLHEGQADAAWQELSANGIVGSEEFYEVQGDVLAMRGEIEEADAMYRRAISAAEEAGLETGYLQLKLDNLVADSSE